MIRACEVRRSTTRALSSTSRLVVNSARATAAWMPANALSARTEIGSRTSPGGKQRQRHREVLHLARERRQDQRERRREQQDHRDHVDDRQRQVRDQVREVLPGRDVRRPRQQPREPAALVRRRYGDGSVTPSRRPQSQRSKRAIQRQKPIISTSGSPSVRIATPSPTDRPLKITVE